MSEAEVDNERHGLRFAFVTGVVFIPGVPLLWGTVGNQPLWSAIPFGLVLGLCFWMLASLGYGLIYFKDRVRRD